MRDLTAEELNKLVSNKVADYENGIGLFVPLTSDQPVIMYTSISRGIPSMHYLGVEIKRKYTGGLYVYSPKKPFDISEHEFSDCNVTAEGVVNDYVDLSITYDQWGGHINGYSEEEKAIKINKPDAIAIAKALGVTGEDLL